jgi:hypothetical protein
MVKAEYIFYAFGIVFLFATIAYFAYEFLFNLSDLIKAIILGLLTIGFFVLAEYLRERDI